MNKNNLLFRAWYYFRMGWSTYFAFILAAINTLTVTYFLAIDNYPSLKSVFLSKLLLLACLSADLTKPDNLVMILNAASGFFEIKLRNSL